jgi:hypothetical protein
VIAGLRCDGGRPNTVALAAASFDAHNALGQAT